jgi:hypothetical protein
VDAPSFSASLSNGPCRGRKSSKSANGSEAQTPSACTPAACASAPTPPPHRDRPARGAPRPLPQSTRRHRCRRFAYCSQQQRRRVRPVTFAGVSQKSLQKIGRNLASPCDNMHTVPSKRVLVNGYQEVNELERHRERARDRDTFIARHSLWWKRYRISSL